MSRVQRPARLVGTVHRLFNRSGIPITEPMLHPTPHEFLLEQWEKEVADTAQKEGTQLVSYQNEELGDLPLNLAFHKCSPDDAPPRFSVIEEYLLLQKVEKVMNSLKQAGAEFTDEGMKKTRKRYSFQRNNLG